MNVVTAQLSPPALVFVYIHSRVLTKPYNNERAYRQIKDEYRQIEEDRNQTRDLRMELFQPPDSYVLPATTSGTSVTARSRSAKKQEPMYTFIQG